MSWLCHGMSPNSPVLRCFDLIMHLGSGYKQYSKHALMRFRRYDSGVGLVARLLRTWRPHPPHRHDVLRSTVVLHSTDRGHPVPRFALPRPGYLGSASSAPGCSPTPGKHTITARTQPTDFLYQEAQVNRARNRTTRTRTET